MASTTLAARPRHKHPSGGVRTDQITGRFRKITVHQLALAWWCHRAGHITRRQLRVWFAAHEMAERRRYADPANGPLRPDYGLDELKALVGGRGSESASAELSADVTRLRRLGLVKITQHAIEFAVSVDQIAVDDVTGFWSMFNQLPHPRRSVPVPRRMVRALAAGFTRGVTAVVIAMLIRSLFWHKETGEYRTDGRTKREWIAEVFGVSVRTVTDARARLTEIGWLVPLDTPQWMLNKYGAHDAINTDWSASDESSGGVEVASIAEGESASPPADFRGEPASPDLNRSLPLTGNQNTRRPAPMRAGPAGVSLRSTRRQKTGSRKKNRRRSPPSAPNIRDVQAEDLNDTGRLLQLYDQAVEIGMAQAGEGGRLDFVAFAERARCRAKKPGALFFWLLRERKSVFITHADEEEAARRIKSHLYGRDQRREQWGGENAPPRQPKPLELTEDEKIVVACRQVAKRHRGTEPFHLARSAKGWTRDHWEAVEASYELKLSQRWTRDDEL